MPDQNSPSDQSPNPVPGITPPVSDTPTSIPEPQDTPPPFPGDIPAEGITPPTPQEQGSAAPGLDIPPVITTGGSPKGKFGGKKVIATILGLLVLVGGLGAGLILVRQQQDIRERAAVDSNACERAGGSCYVTPSCARVGRSTANGGNGCIASRGEICCGGLLSQTPIPTQPPATSPPTSTLCSKDCVSSQSQCKSGTQVGGVGYGDCGAGEYCCDAQGSPSSTQQPQVNICALSQRDPASQGYCDRSAPNTQNCTDKAEGSSCTIVSQCGGGTGSCVVISQGGANSECQCQKGSAQPPTTPTTTSPPGGGPTAQCLDIKAYDTNWNQLTAQQLSSLKTGDKVRFSVGGQTSSGSFDKARFKINGVQRAEVTQKRPASEEYYDEYTIPGGITTFTINAQIHHTSLGWSN